MSKNQRDAATLKVHVINWLQMPTTSKYFFVLFFAFSKKKNTLSKTANLVGGGGVTSATIPSLQQWERAIKDQAANNEPRNKKEHSATAPALETPHCAITAGIYVNRRQAVAGTPHIMLKID